MTQTTVLALVVGIAIGAGGFYAIDRLSRPEGAPQELAEEPEGPAAVSAGPPPQPAERIGALEARRQARRR